MRTSLCIIMAAVLSLCLFGVGSDIEEQPLQDTTASDTVGLTVTEISSTPSGIMTGSNEMPTTETACVENVTEATTDSDAEKPSESTSVSNNGDRAEKEESTAPQTEDISSVTISAPAEAVVRRSADTVAGGLTDDSTVNVYDHNTGTYMKITLREYIIGVVAAEMPMNFGEEALQAQAIAARTYAIYKLCRGGVSDHPDAAICNSPSHCCAFIPESAAFEKWGDSANAVLDTSRRAVTDTENTVIIYDEACICAAWHSSSAGYTKNAADVWGGHVAYLCSVPTEEERRSVGHGVGMSQYGAKEMADGGALAEEILTHYYTGCTVVCVE